MYHEQAGFGGKVTQAAQEAKTLHVQPVSIVVYLRWSFRRNLWFFLFEPLLLTVMQCKFHVRT
jgi:hypothetical protein